MNFSKISRMSKLVLEEYKDEKIVSISHLYEEVEDGVITATSIFMDEKLFKGFIKIFQVFELHSAAHVGGWIHPIEMGLKLRELFDKDADVIEAFLTYYEYSDDNAMSGLSVNFPGNIGNDDNVVMFIVMYGCWIGMWYYDKKDTAFNALADRRKENSKGSRSVASVKIS